MVTVTANDAVQAAFSGIAQRAEIRDPRGKLIGYFEPTEEMRRLLEEARRHIDPEEIKRLKAIKEPGVTTKELLAYLRSLAPEQ
jgi:hypothetical protein